jgi:hypothetical protein
VQRINTLKQVEENIAGRILEREGKFLQKSTVKQTFTPQITDQVLMLFLEPDQYIFTGAYPDFLGRRFTNIKTPSNPLLYEINMNI